jgi:hypothetical protein
MDSSAPLGPGRARGWPTGRAQGVAGPVLADRVASHRGVDLLDRVRPGPCRCSGYGEAIPAGRGEERRRRLGRRDECGPASPRDRVGAGVSRTKKRPEKVAKTDHGAGPRHRRAHAVDGRGFASRRDARTRFRVPPGSYSPVEFREDRGAPRRSGGDRVDHELTWAIPFWRTGSVFARDPARRGGRSHPLREVPQRPAPPVNQGGDLPFDLGGSRPPRGLHQTADPRSGRPAPGVVTRRSTRRMAIVH